MIVVAAVAVLGGPAAIGMAQTAARDNAANEIAADQAAAAVGDSDNSGEE